MTSFVCPCLIITSIIITRCCNMSLLPLVFLLLLMSSVSSSIDSAAGSCEALLTELRAAVCVSFLHRVYGAVSSAHIELSPAVVEDQLLQSCSLATGKEARLCYYLGASNDAATRVTASVARPLASHVPVEKICQRLSSRDTQICQLRYEPQRDLSSDGLRKLRVAELRNILASWGEECRGCLEKHEYVSLIEEKAALHVPTVEL